MSPFEFRDELDIFRNYMFGLSGGKEIVTLAFFVLIQYQSVTDRRTDGQMDRWTSLLWLYQCLHSLHATGLELPFSL